MDAAIEPAEEAIDPRDVAMDEPEAIVIEEPIDMLTEPTDVAVDPAVIPKDEPIGIAMEEPEDTVPGESPNETADTAAEDAAGLAVEVLLPGIAIEPAMDIAIEDAAFDAVELAGAVAEEAAFRADDGDAGFEEANGFAIVTNG